MKKIPQGKDLIVARMGLLLILLLSIIPLIPLFHSDLPFTHDGKDHVARIANFYANLSEGTIIPRWGANLNWGYGHPVLMFLYPLPSYFASFFHLLGFSFVDSVKLVFGASFILSGLTMYLWLQSFLPRTSALVGGLLYLFAPYRFVDLYVRGAIGEHVAFIFPPLVLYFLFAMTRNTKSHWYLIGGSFSLAGLILAHNAISLMFLPIIFLYIVFLVIQSQHKKRFLFTSLTVILFGFLLSAFFWLPALLEGKYTLREIVTEGLVIERFSSFDKFVYSPWSFGQSGSLSVQVGLLQWVAVLAAIPLLVRWYKKKKQYYVLLLSSVILFGITLFLMTNVSSFVWEHVSLLQKFQFPWRFLSLTIFATAVIGAFVFASIPQKKQFHFFILGIIILLFSTSTYWQTNGYFEKPESFYTGIYEGTTDTGESSPIWSERFMEDFPKARVEIIDGKGTIEETSRSIRKHAYVTDGKTPIGVRENTLYFPGWIVLVDGQEVPIQFQDINNRGIITFTVPEGKHEVILRFTETKMRLLANAISGISIFILFGWGIIILIQGKLKANKHK